MVQAQVSRGRIIIMLWAALGQWVLQPLVTLLR